MQQGLGQTADTQECIEWDGPIHKSGYAYTRKERSAKSPLTPVHRLVWEEERGPIPEGMDVCHRCDNPPCINIDHLFLGTHAENMKDMVLKGRLTSANLAKTSCKRGHAFTGDNTYTTKQGWRECRTCLRMHHRRSYAKSREQVA